MRLLLILLSFLSLPVLANPYTTGERYLINRMNPIFRSYSLGSQLFDQSNTAIGTYDFSKLGGAVGAVNLRGTLNELTVPVPIKSIIRSVLVDVITQPTSGGLATVALGCSSSNDLLAATAKASLTVGQQAGAIVQQTVSGYEKLAAQCNLKATIATAALTAGKIVVYVNYFPGY